ncbi:hypothetical protein HK405_006259 [Cladochytrium tenue]|nr:hypothetical protein HK405_006259 [Cladochytrium tenue]
MRTFTEVNLCMWTHAGAIDAFSTDAKLLRQISRAGWARQAVFEITQSHTFNNSILAVIVINTVVLSLETVASINLKYDLCIVAISVTAWLIPYFLTSALSIDVRIFQLFRLFRTVRAVRSLRVLRAINFLRSLQVIISTVLKSIPAMGNIVLMASLTLYVFAVVGTVCYRDADQARFGSIGATLFSLFQLMTLDHWSNIYRNSETNSPTLYYFVVIVIILETFVLLKV